ncbi:MAG: hypothetical protein COU29_04030 [Candidatus Magasanikbacteria bacterium CG10_big_fil_rev_8_21_14_0_10_36_32]|uniref:C-methyltransferase domain-containing protein n=1 Tax=Candidatus Magasanikbacteria bacterium CG10_big_fil_rev_8_21_14_0_10_36_32 TaxID=1974646 RepID=A0A2M6W5V0_9BACT|nr:MAG: hypothetical protein COU29_04030 [Candidatus Magasanikbacteria bacterium CG10_big_fil_rev_8_21_14_0_10_36_32]
MNRVCPICTNLEKTLLYQQNFNKNADISLMEKYDVVVCNKCGFVFADSVPSPDIFDNYYAAMSKYEFNYKDGVVPEEHIKHFTKIADFITPHLKNKNVKILDIGCSTGGLLSILKSKGYLNLLGIDPSSSCVNAVKKLYGIEAMVNNISNFNSNEKFDLIILSAVLEHLVDFESSMCKIRSLLSDSGMLFIEVPDAERFDLYISAPFQQFSVEHINYFSQYSIENLFSVFSFEMLDLKVNENKSNPSIDPDIFVLGKKTENKDVAISKDDISVGKIKNYINESAKIDFKIKKLLEEKLSDKDKIIVWGVGTHTQRLIGAGMEISKILYFVDSNIRYIGKQLNGIEIKSPQNIKEEVPILISTHSFQKEIIHQIREILKLNNEIIKLYQ